MSGHDARRDDEVKAEPSEATGRRPGRRRIGRIAGVEVDLPLVTIPLFIILAWLFGTDLLPVQEADAGYSPLGHWILGLGGASILFGSALAHDLAHLLVGRAVGVRIERATLFFHGGALQGAKPAANAGGELARVAAGPAANILLALIFVTADVLFGEVRWVAPLVRIGWVSNVLLGGSYLLPALPLDGGHLVRALAWLLSGSLVTGTRIACWVSRAFAALLAAISLFMLARVGISIWLFTAFLALIVWAQAGTTWRVVRLREGLRDRTASDALEPAPEPLPRIVSVAEALLDTQRRVPRSQPRTWLVEFQGRLGGIVTSSMLRRVPDRERPSTPVGQVARKLRWDHLLEPGTALEAALERMTRDGLPILPVIEDERLVGIVSREGILRIADGTAAARGAGS